MIEKNRLQIHIQGMKLIYNPLKNPRQQKTFCFLSASVIYNMQKIFFYNKTRIVIPGSVEPGTHDNTCVNEIFTTRNVQKVLILSKHLR